MTTEFETPDYSYRPTVESGLIDNIPNTMLNFTAKYGVPVSRKLVSLGYGPLGEDDPNYVPVFRRRYYMKLDDVMSKLQMLHDNYATIYTEDIKEQLDEFITDIRWFLTSRDNLHTGSIPHNERITIRS